MSSQHMQTTLNFTVISTTSVSDFQRLSECAETVTIWHLTNGVLLSLSKAKAFLSLEPGHKWQNLTVQPASAFGAPQSRYDRLSECSVSPLINMQHSITTSPKFSVTVSITTVVCVTFNIDRLQHCEYHKTRHQTRLLQCRVVQHQ